MYMSKKNIDSSLSKSDVNLYSFIIWKGKDILLSKASGKDVAQEKRELIEEIVAKARLVNLSFNLDSILKKMRYEYIKVKCMLVNRGISGISSSFGLVPFEIGLNFDPISNVPFIPGSSIKGAVRATFSIYFKSKQNIEERIFGGKNFIGVVRFSDAYPINLGKNGLLLYPDVITPHYTDAEDELSVKPTPIVHLSIAPGTLFLFYIYWRPNNLSSNEKYMLRSALLLALIRGIGARTRIGYSFFKIVNIEEVKPVE